MPASGRAGRLSTPTASATSRRSTRRACRCSACASTCGWAREAQALDFREIWLERGQAIIDSLGLPFEVDVANDPFFGRTGKLLAANQREQSLKFELLVPITSASSRRRACSFNYHQDLFGRAWGIETAAGETAHTACVGFGLERITLGAVQASRLRRRGWPAEVRDVLGL